MTERGLGCDFVEILTLFGCQISADSLSHLFGISREQADQYLIQAQEAGLLTDSHSALRAAANLRISDMHTLLPACVAPCFRFLRQQETEQIPTSFSGIVANLTAHGADSGDVIDFAIQIGGAFIQDQKIDIAAKLYLFCVLYCKENHLRKEIFEECVLNLSKADFSRGSNPEETANLQKEVVSQIDMHAPTLNEALIMLYAGLVQHFVGNEGEGFSMRETAIDWLETLNTAAVRHDVVALMGWHIYLSGRFREAIAYYEDMILDLESHRETEIATMAYPPIIYSYMFLGEFQKGMILNEIIYRRAIEHHDEPTAMMMHCIQGRIYISSNDNENGADILYEALAESRHKGFIWGQYYALCALCNLNLNRGQIGACYETLLLMQELKRNYNIGRMYSSPFMLDVLQKLEQQNYAAVPGMEYKNELLRHIGLQNIHMKGVSLRHLALLELKRCGSINEILTKLDESISLLEISGNQLEMGRSLVEKARILRKAGDSDGAKVCASKAWEALGTHTKEFFPNELIDSVKMALLTPDLMASLKALALEIRSIVNGNVLLLRLLTRLSRLLGVESGGAAVCRGAFPELIATQSIDQQQTASVQYQRMMGWITYTQEHGSILCKTTKNAGRPALLADLDSDPTFLLTAPLSDSDGVRVIFYFESSYRTAELTEEDTEALQSFLREQTPHVLATLSYTPEAPAEALPADGTQQATPDIYVGVSPVIRDIVNHIELVAKMNVPVLLTGETGTGKEVFAREIFRRSGCKGPFVKVNCGAIPDSLIESQLFGYERGSFTGAYQTHQGYFELANGGTIFLDEVGELSLSAQVSLLRILQEKELMRIGGSKTIRVDFRLIAATNRNLREEVERGNFRSDLFFRLNIIPIEIPALRNRKADIPGFVRYFLQKHMPMVNRHFQVTPEAMELLLRYDWPGNVRELENAVQRAMVFSAGSCLQFDMIRELAAGSLENFSDVKTLEEVEREYILRILQKCGGQIGGNDGAAALLGLKRTTLISKMEKLKISSAL